LASTGLFFIYVSLKRCLGNQAFRIRHNHFYRSNGTTQDDPFCRLRKPSSKSNNLKLLFLSSGSLGRLVDERLVNVRNDTTTGNGGLDKSI